MTATTLEIRRTGSTSAVPLALRILAEAPDRLLLLFLSLALAVGPATVFGQFRPVVVIPLFLVLAGVLQRAAPDGEPTSNAAARDDLGKESGTRRTAAAAAIAVTFAVAWVVLNLSASSQYLIDVRDPAVYTLRGLWLTHHASPNIPISDAVMNTLKMPNTVEASSGFKVVGSQMQPQGMSLLPGLMAVLGWVAGTPGVLAANLIIGGFGLLAVYAFARRMTGPFWALAPMSALGLSMPMVAFSRAAYTEPTALALTVTGALLLWVALDQHRPLLGVVAGLSIGASFFTRIDGLLVVLGAMAGLGAAAVFARSAYRRADLGQLILATALGAATSVAVGFFDLARNSTVYEAEHWGQIAPLAAAAAVVTVAALIGAGPLWRIGEAGWLGSHRIRVANFVIVVGATAFVVMAARPLFWVAHGRSLDVALTSGLADAADPTRTFDESTISWHAWYFSWPLVVCAAFGLLFAVRGSVFRFDPRLAAPLATTAIVALLYLCRPEITPDQIWAMRRFLPVVIPFGLLFAFLVPHAVYDKARAPAMSMAVLLAGAPMLAWEPDTVRTTELGGVTAMTEALCSQVDGANVILADSGDGARIFLPTIRVVCGEDVVLTSNPTRAELAEIGQRLGPARPTIVVTTNPVNAPWAILPSSPTIDGSYTMWERPLTTRPRHGVTTARPLWIGVLLRNGEVWPRG